MDLAKVIDLVKKLEAAEPKVLEGVSHFLDVAGPFVSGHFPKLSGNVEDVKKALDFLSKISAEYLPVLDKILDVLSKIEAAL